VAERDANITFTGTLEDDTAASVALAQSRMVMDDTIRAFRGLATQVRPTVTSKDLETRNRWKSNVCIAFMHQKMQRIFAQIILTQSD
jgi:hypothetical protein